jgi:hypothetical protein
MITLVRYEAELLLRSHRWILPAVFYAVFVWLTGGAGGEQLGAGLGWSAAALVPVVAWLTRQMLIAEPGEARSCIAAAGGPRRVQVAALIAALAAGMVLGLGGVVYDLVAGKAPGSGPAGYARTIAVGLAATLICAAVGSAIGALCNPPVVRTVAGAALSTIGVVVAALVSSVSPANAAIRVAGTQPHASAWPVGPPLIAAAALLAVTWTVSAVLAARRGL